MATIDLTKTDQSNRGIFLADEETGAITDTITIATGSSSVVGREIDELSDATTERSLFIELADDDASTPTIKAQISLKFGDGWSDYTDLETAAAVPRTINIQSYDKTWWKKNNGVRIKLIKSGAGAVTCTNANWI